MRLDSRRLVDAFPASSPSSFAAFDGPDQVPSEFSVNAAANLIALSAALAVPFAAPRGRSNGFLPKPPPRHGAISHWHHICLVDRVDERASVDFLVGLDPIVSAKKMTAIE